MDSLLRQLILKLQQLLSLLQAENTPDMPLEPPKLPQEPSIPANPPPMNPDELLPWNTTTRLSHENWHNVRALCDLEGLSHEQKEVLTACVWRESEFMTNPRPNQNKLKDGTVWSSDFGIVQVNDYWNIGPGKPFPTVQFVINSPEACVRWMARYYKQHGNLGVGSSGWASFTTGAYKQFLGKTL